jgi:hypothetical protein
VRPIQRAWLLAGTLNLFAVGCGGGSSSPVQQPAILNPPPPPAIVAVTISPDLPSSVWQGGTLQFTATVTGTSNTAVTWSVQQGAAGGSITAQGLYTAPAAEGTFVVAATSQADPTKSATATVFVSAVSIYISPSPVGVARHQQRQFAAEVLGTVHRAVTWSVQEGAAGGSMSNQGLYTAPVTLGTFHVIATSAADPSKSATATVAVVEKGFAATGSMIESRAEHAATLLLDGRVLITGGYADLSCTFSELDDYWLCLHPARASAELYDPATRSFTATGSMIEARAGHSATLLPSGQVLIAGGYAEFSGMATAELYDPATGEFTATGSMNQVRGWHTATALADGRVLVAGGPDGAAAEVYDPTAGTFTSVGEMGAVRLLHAATLLPGGRVLLSGGFADYSSCENAVTHSSTEVFDATAGTFTPGPAMISAREGHTSTLLSGGALLLAGGYRLVEDAEWGCALVLVAGGELLDPDAGPLGGSIEMTRLRRGHTATLLLDGQVLLAGGDWNSPSAEIFDPATGMFAVTGSTTHAGPGHTAALLADGSVLVTGGWGDNRTLNSAEIYE